MPARIRGMKHGLRPCSRYGVPARLRTCCLTQRAPTLAGFGGVGVDYLASVARFPEPDEKLRTQRLDVQGGGNCGNASTALARLGCDVRVMSCIGVDKMADSIIAEFQGDGVRTEFLQSKSDSASPFTYIIVDSAGGTRTCIHTPGPQLEPADLSDELCQRFLEGVDLAFFDGRLTEAAIVVAKAARRAGVPVLVEAERLRPNLESLMAEADYLVTSQSFPQAWTGEDSFGDALLATAMRFPNIRWMTTTMGKSGSVLLQPSQARSSGGETLQSMLSTLTTRLAQEAPERELGCQASTGVRVTAGSVISTEQAVTLTFERSSASSEDTLQRALAAATREAAASAAPDAYQTFLAQPSAISTDWDDVESQEPELVAEVYMCSASQLDASMVVDTTGAGDAFIASLMYGICKGQPPEAMLQLASAVSACKCTTLGARNGLPHRVQVDAGLL